MHLYIKNERSIKMKKCMLPIYLFALLASICSCAEMIGYKAYDLNNPLRFYDGGFSVQNVLKETFWWPPYAKPIYSNQDYIEWNGILSNTNFVTLIGKTNLVHIFYNGSIWQTNLYTNIILSNDKYFEEYFIQANEKYFVTLTTNYQLKVYQSYNTQLVFQDTVSSLFALQAMLGNGNSDLFAYCYGFTNLKLIILSNTNTIYQWEGLSPAAFSPKNKYLIYTDFNEKSKYSFWNKYIYTYRLHNGQPFIYDIQNNTNYSIATYQCLDTGVGFKVTTPLGLRDGFYAIDYSLSNIYLYLCNPNLGYPYELTLYDGTYAPDAEGLYRIDISSLGLSE